MADFMCKSWEEVCHHVLPIIRAPFERVTSAEECRKAMGGNRFARNDDTQLASLREKTRAGLRVRHHKNLPNTHEPTLHTLRYLFWHMRCGIYVRIQGGQIHTFAPFVNPDYRNQWSANLGIDDMGAYFDAKAKVARREHPLPVDRWWCNAGILCNIQSPNLWGNFLLKEYMEMLQETCRQRHVPNVEFFLNKRDHPQLKRDRTEPHDFVWETDALPLRAERHATYAPILSGYTSEQFSDIPFPLPQDWKVVTQRQPSPVPWEKRRATAVFRGGATGAGVTMGTNARLAIAGLSEAWSKTHGGEPLLDARITAWNIRDKKLRGAPMRFLDPGTMPFKGGRQFYLTPEQQGSFKYVVYIAGHSAASRYGGLLRSGSVILKVADTPGRTAAPDLWFFPLLRPWVDHVPVAADLSDLKERILWCRSHDEECRRIASRGLRLWERYLGVDGLLDKMQMALWHAARCWS